MFWKTRWDVSIDGSGTPYRTLVCYKETHASAKIDPQANVWTGTWRDPRFSPPADGGRPENALTGSIFTVNVGAGGADFGTAIQVPSDLGKMRLWRNTSVATLAPGQTATLANGTLGYEWNEDLDNGFRPAGLIPLSMTVENVPERILDYGSTYGPGTATHSLTLYRAASGALVFSTGTVQWSFGLDANHDGQATTPDVRMQQATVNIFADMGVQPGSLMAGLVPATASTDKTPPSSVITSPVAGATLQTGVPITIQGTATDGGGGIVAVVEISTDGGATWHRATGGNSWTYTWTPNLNGTANIRTRAVDDSANQEVPTSGISVNTVGASSLWNNSVTPTLASIVDNKPVELGLKFTSDTAGTINGVRFYKGSSNTGTHVAHLWTSTGTLLATATFTNETANGWQQVFFSSPVAITANTTYVVSYFAPAGGYADNNNYFTNTGYDNAPLHAPSSSASGGNGVYVYGSSGGFPTNTYLATNYCVDVLFTANSSDTTPPTVTAHSPASGATGVTTTATVTATFSEPVQPSSVVITLTGPGGAVAGTLSYDNSTNTATFTPAAPLAAQTAYTVTVSGAKDLNNNVMASTSWSFTTASKVWRTSSPSDFAAGTFNGTMVSDPTNGGIKLASTARDDFNGSALNSSWSSTSWRPSAQATVTGGVVSISAEQLLDTAVIPTETGPREASVSRIPGSTSEWPRTWPQLPGIPGSCSARERRRTHSSPA